MPNFTPVHLGKWEPLFTDLVNGEGSELTEEGTWMLGDKPGLVCVFEDSEALYVEASTNIAKTLQCYIRGGSECDFRTLVGVIEMGASLKNAASRAKSGPLAQRISRRVEKFRYRVVPAPAKSLSQLADAFNVVADTRYAGPSAMANRALDALPQ
ncbi:MAG: hypothetical protein J4O07_06365 [Chloroflexi bacterium]|nr:hypothetical protein [Chloroflexota bacterium]MCI0871420.1 hypothetical protein [Chloroflexota bacterium]